MYLVLWSLRLTKKSQFITKEISKYDATTWSVEACVGNGSADASPAGHLSYSAGLELNGE